MTVRGWIENWVSMLWHAMSASAKGYRRHSLRRTGRGGDRRADKLEQPNRVFRRIRNRMRSA